MVLIITIMAEEDLFHLIALSLVKHIGPVTAKRLIAQLGSPKEIFLSGAKISRECSFVTQRMVKALQDKKIFTAAETEMSFIKKYQITCLPYSHKAYPKRLKHCDDSPLVLFVKGDAQLNPAKALSIVGTRKATDRGRLLVERIIEELLELGHSPAIISGLAYGIDIAAHKAALEHNLPTFAILGHGLHTIYPASHKHEARKIAAAGALITDFATSTPLDRNNFLRRNRIIAGMADATLVVESRETGGALITASMANGYSRDVFAVPGRPDDAESRGCNQLIKSLYANMVESGEDIAYYMKWEKDKCIQTSLFTQLSPDEQTIANVLKEYNELPIDNLAIHTQLPMNTLASSLLELEFKGVVAVLPGKIFKLKNPLFI